MIGYGDPERVHSHDAFHRFFRGAAWKLPKFWELWGRLLVGLLGHPNVVRVLGDDTVHKKTGRKVEGAKSCRDAVRSTRNKVVYAWGLQLVLLCLRVQTPWGGQPWALPINMRLYRKKTGSPSDRTCLDLMAEMIAEVVGWFPERQVIFVGDGFYAPLAGRDFERVTVISRIRHDAALYKPLLARHVCKRGRPRTKGDRMPTPAQIASQAKSRDWKLVEVVERGTTRERLVLVRKAVWHSVRPGKPILLVVSRDPTGKEKDDFFFTTDLTMDAAAVIAAYAERWSIEVTYRDAKQILRIETPQTWKRTGPEKVAAFGYMLYGLICMWFLRHGNHRVVAPAPWYLGKRTPSFLDALAAIRLQIWRSRYSQAVLTDPQSTEFTETLMRSASRAA
jgi:hypothetical protein